MLRTFANGFGMLGLAGLLSRDVVAATLADAAAAAPGMSTNPLAVKPPMYAPKAKRVIFLDRKSNV